MKINRDKDGYITSCEGDKILIVFDGEILYSHINDDYFLYDLAKPATYHNKVKKTVINFKYEENLVKWWGMLEGKSVYGSNGPDFYANEEITNAYYLVIDTLIQGTQGK